MIELERTFLAKKLPQLNGCPQEKIVDVYFPSSAEHPTLRLRQKGGRFEITKKQPVIGRDSSRQQEQTIPLTRVEFEELAQAGGKRLEKTRYEYRVEGKVFEIDVFEGLLKGLVLVDIEFMTEPEKAAFRMPEFCLAEVTQEKAFAGGMLAGKSYKDIEAELGKWEYKKLLQEGG